MTTTVTIAADGPAPDEIKAQIIRIRQGFGRPLPPR